MEGDGDFAVDIMVENEIIIGDGNGLRLDDCIKRSEFITMMVRIK